MELWIRSQDKESLVKVDNLYISIGNYICYYVEKGKEKPETYYRPAGVLAMYETKERALEVLDEIQKLIQPVMLFQNCECDKETLDEIKEIGACICHDNARVEQINQTILYEMPKE